MPEADIIVSHEAVEDMVHKYGKRALLMGTLKEDGSLSIPQDCFQEAASLLGDRSTSEPVFNRTGPRMMHFPKDHRMGDFIDKVGAVRKRKIVELTSAVQNASDEEQAKQYWRKLEHLIFGI